MLNIVILDGHAMNPGDLDWSPLEAYGKLTIYDRTPADQTCSRAAEADAVLTNKTVLDAEVIAALPKLRYIGVSATGYNVVDIPAARAAGIVVTNVPAYSTASVAQTVFALLLEHCQNVALHSESVHSGEWTDSLDFAYWKTSMVELEGKTMGIVGLGGIGQAVAKLAQAFGMRVVAAVRTQREYPAGIEILPLEEVFKQADVLSLHCPLTPETEKLVNAERLALMKPSAFLVNTSRGPVIDPPALANALNRGQLAGAGLDVMVAEPPAANDPLLTARNCFITPHLAWATKEARIRLMSTVVANLGAFAGGNPINVVS